MREPCTPAAFLLAVCNFKGFPARKPGQVPRAALRPALAALSIRSMTLPAGQCGWCQCEIVLKVHSHWPAWDFENVYVVNKYASLFFPVFDSPVREIHLSNRCLKCFDRVFVSVSSIILVWWQADSRKRFAPNVLGPCFSLSHLTISFSVVPLARALLGKKKKSLPRTRES